jgi:DNA-binding NarL/FixJ family response regulator
MIRLVLADDHAIVRSGLMQIFSLLPDIEVLAQASNGGEVLEILRKHEHIDLIMLDLTMDGISGADLISRIKAHKPTLPVLILSMHNEPQVATRMLRSGANGYITKDCNPDVLLAAMRKVAGGGKYIAPELAEKMIFDVSASDERPLHNLLSDRERDVLRMLTQGKVVKEIADQLSISNKTVSTYKIRLMEKLNLSNMADLMRYAMEHGLLD